MLNISKLLKMAGISAGVLGTTWLAAGWCSHCQTRHLGDHCPAQTIGAVDYPYDCGCEEWDSDDEEDYIRQQEARLRELRRRRAQHHAQSEARRREQAINNIQKMNTSNDLQAILDTLQIRANELGFQIRDGQIIPQNNPCGGHNPHYGCNDYGYNCQDDDYNYNCHNNAYGCW